MIQESRDFRFQLLQEIGIVRLQVVYLSHPITCLASVNDDRQILVVGTQHELGEEGYLVTVLPLLRPCRKVWY